MTLLIDIKELDNYKSRELIPLKCKNCNDTFYIEKHFVQCAIKGTKELEYCSKDCANKAKLTRKICECPNCQLEFYRNLNELNKGNKKTFCSHSCKATYWNKNRKTGTNRSKLEKWLEVQLIQQYSDLKIIYNDTKTIGCELDIYIPNLKLAFELNGIFHFEPIYGLEKLTKTQIRDKQKILTSSQNGIELCVIDTTSLKYFKAENAKKFLDIITKIINSKLARVPSIEEG